MPPVPPGQSVLAVIQSAWRDGAQSLLDKNKPRLHQPARRRWAGAACFQCVTPSARAIFLRLPLCVTTFITTFLCRRLGGQKSIQLPCHVKKHVLCQPGSAPDKKRGPSLGQNVRVAALTVLACLRPWHATIHHGRAITCQAVTRIARATSAGAPALSARRNVARPRLGA